MRVLLFLFSIFLCFLLSFLVINRPSDAGVYWLAFLSNRDGTAQVYIMNPDGSAVRRLTSEGQGHRDLQWSPDGRWITGSAQRNATAFAYNIYRVDRAGRMQWLSASRLFNVTSPVWSPDGEWLVYVTLEQDIGREQIYRMRPDGSQAQNLTFDSFAADFNPAVSPDGERIAFVSRRDGNDEIYMMRLDGSDLRRLTDTVVNEGYPAWSPDGEWLAFISLEATTRGLQRTLYRLRVSDGYKEALASLEIAAAPVWSPDGTSLTFSAWNGGNQIMYQVKLDGDNNALRLMVETQANDREPAWSPDGKWLAFTVESLQSRNIYKIRADGSALHSLTNGVWQLNYSPVWSPEINSSFNLLGLLGISGMIMLVIVLWKRKS